MRCFHFHTSAIIHACIAMCSFMVVSCTALAETAQGTAIMVKEQMGIQTPTSSAALAPRGTEANLDAEIETDKFSEIWRGMDELVTDYEDVLSGNDSSWFGRRTKNLNRAAFKLLASKAGLESYDRILELQEDVAELEKDKNELAAGRLGYPVSSYNPFAMTREKCDKKIKELENEIAEFNAEINKQTTILLSDLNRHGQLVDKKHLKYLLTAAGGDDIMQMMNLAIILRQVQYAIGKQIKSSSQFNGAQLQRYVGIQLVLLLAYQQAHVVGIENIQGKFLPKLDDIQKKAEANYREAQALRNSSEDGAGYLVQNQKISENTILIAKQYRTALQEMVKSLMKSRERVDRNVAVTRNTFKTVTTGASLLQLIQDSSQEYSELISFNPPLLDTIYSDQMMEAFQQVSAQLKKD